MAYDSYARKVLDKALELAGATGEAVAADVSEAMFTQTFRAHKRVLNILGEHAREGRLRRIRQGVYGPVQPGERQPDKREVMWRLLRMRRRVMVADLMEMAGVSKEYAREWLLMLTRNGVLRKEQAPGMAATWILINDPVTMPNDTENAARLRKLREKKAKLARQLDAIDAAVGDMRQILNTMEDDQ